MNDFKGKVFAAESYILFQSVTKNSKCRLTYIYIRLHTFIYVRYLCFIYFVYVHLFYIYIYISLCIDKNHITDDYLGEGFIYTFFFFLFSR